MGEPHIVDIVAPTVVFMVVFFFVVYQLSGNVLIAAIAGGIGSPIGAAIGSTRPVIGTSA